MPPTVDDMLFDLFRLRSAFRRQIEDRVSPEGITETVRASLTETVLAALRERDKEIEHLLRVYTQSLSECILTQTKLYELCNGPVRNQRHQRSRGGTPYSRNSTDWKRDGGTLTRIVGRRGGSKVLINNLDLDIDEDDIEEIFQEAGEVKEVTIDTDDGGRHLGIAHVTFQDPADAVKAVQEYDAANVDGRPMFLRLIEEGRARRVSRQACFDDSVYSTQYVGPPMTPKEELFGSAMFDDFNYEDGRGRGRGGNRGRGRRRYGATGYGRNLSSTSQANLDADLDDYISKYETPSIIVDPTVDGQPPSGMEVEEQSVHN